MALKKKIEINEGTGIYAEYIRISRRKYEKDMENGKINFYLDVFMSKEHADSGKKPINSIPMSAPFSEIGVENPMLIVDWEKVPELYNWVKTKFTITATRIVKKLVEEKVTKPTSELTEQEISHLFTSHEKFKEWKQVHGNPETVDLVQSVERDVEEGYDLPFFHDAEDV